MFIHLYVKQNNKQNLITISPSMKSYGIVKPKDTQYYNSYNVKLYEKVHPNLHIDKIVHPSPLPKPADHVVSRFSEQKSYHVIEKYAKDRARGQGQIFNNIIINNTGQQSNVMKQSIGANRLNNTERISRQTHSLQRFTRKPIFGRNNYETVQNSPQRQLSKNILYHEVFIPAYENISKELSKTEHKDKKMILERSNPEQKEQQIINIPRNDNLKLIEQVKEISVKQSIRSSKKLSIKQSQKQSMKQSKKQSIKLDGQNNIINNSMEISMRRSQKVEGLIKNSSNNSNSNENKSSIASNKKTQRQRYSQKQSQRQRYSQKQRQRERQRQQKILQIQRNKLKLTSNVTNLQIQNKLQSVKVSLQPIKKQLEISQKQSKQIRRQKPFAQLKPTHKKQPIYQYSPNKPINVQYTVNNNQSVQPINIKINIIIKNQNPNTESKIMPQQEDRSSCQSIFSQHSSYQRQTMSVVLNERESQKKKIKRISRIQQKQKSIHLSKSINMNKINSSKLIHQNSMRSDQPSVPSILRLKPKALKMASQASNRSKYEQSEGSSISLSVYAIKGINPIVI